MASRKPGQGQVIAVTGTRALELRRRREEEARKRAARAAPHNGRWRPEGSWQGEGLKVALRRIKGLTDNDVLAVPLRFQVPPIGELGREWNYEWSKFTTLRRGERSRPMGRTLQTLDFSTMLLDHWAQEDAMGFVVWPHAPEPQKVLRELRWIMGVARGSDQSSPFRLVISEMAVWDEYLVNGTFVLKRLRATQKQTRGTEYVDLGFEEYDPLEVGKRAQGKPDRWHTLRRGDDLYEIAKKYLRAPSKWRAIASANGIAKSVSPGSETELAKWAKRHNRKRLKIPGNA